MFDLGLNGRRLPAIMALVVATAVAGCSTSAATASVAPSVSASASTAASAAGVTASATVAASMTPAITASPTSAPTTHSTPAPTPTPAKPAATPTPLPALAIGLCTGAQLHLAITSWIGDPGAGTVYAHLTATNVSSASCSMRGTSEAQILNGSGSVISDAGSGAAKVSSSDPVYTLAPNGTINTITQWGNWCKTAPSQSIRVAMVEPFGLGRIVAPAAGVAPVPTCYASGSGSVVSSEAWLP
ncbi:MAG TPA: DUF4232 domain-containing protein [Candidatus Limnocylindrales bacterium]